MEFGIRITAKSPIGTTGKVAVPEFANWLNLNYQSVLENQLVQVFQGLLRESQFEKIAHLYRLQAEDILSPMSDIPCPDTSYLCPHLYKFASASESDVELKVMLVAGTDSKYETEMMRQLSAAELRDRLVSSLIETESPFDLFPLG